jgi:hypothetical protein
MKGKLNAKKKSKFAKKELNFTIHSLKKNKNIGDVLPWPVRDAAVGILPLRHHQKRRPKP